MKGAKIAGARGASLMKPDTSMFEFVRRLLHFRQVHPALRGGGLVHLQADENQYALPCARLEKIGCWFGVWDS